MLFVYCLNKTFLTDDIWTFCLTSFFSSIKFFSKYNCQERQQTENEAAVNEAFYLVSEFKF